jgi:hypothetical protein
MELYLILYMFASDLREMLYGDHHGVAECGWPSSNASWRDVVDGAEEGGRRRDRRDKRERISGIRG